MMAELNPVPLGRCRGPWRERQHRTVPTIGKSGTRPFTFPSIGKATVTTSRPVTGARTPEAHRVTTVRPRKLHLAHRCAFHVQTPQSHNLSHHNNADLSTRSQTADTYSSAVSIDDAGTLVGDARPLVGINLPLIATLCILASALASPLATAAEAP